MGQPLEFRFDRATTLNVAAIVALCESIAFAVVAAILWWQWDRQLVPAIGFTIYAAIAFSLRHWARRLAASGAVASNAACVWRFLLILVFGGLGGQAFVLALIIPYVIVLVGVGKLLKSAAVPTPAATVAEAASGPEGPRP